MSINAVKIYLFKIQPKYTKITISIVNVKIIGLKFNQKNKASL